MNWVFFKLQINNCFKSVGFQNSSLCNDDNTGQSLGITKVYAYGCVIDKNSHIDFEFRYSGIHVSWNGSEYENINKTNKSGNYQDLENVFYITNDSSSHFFIIAKHQNRQSDKCFSFKSIKIECNFNRKIFLYILEFPSTSSTFLKYKDLERSFLGLLSSRTACSILLWWEIVFFQKFGVNWRKFWKKS